MAASTPARPKRSADPVLALTMGEPAGIGGELSLAAWRLRDRGVPPFVVIDDVDRLQALARLLDWDVPIQVISSAEMAADVFVSALPVLHQPLRTPVRPGETDPANAAAVIASIKTAVALANSRQVGAIVTNPIHKKALYDAGFPFPGHTEFLAVLTGDAREPVMMLAGPSLKVALVTIHLGLRRAIEAITTDAIIRVAQVAGEALVRDFGIHTPRIAVAGLNPHAGEDGALGDEDREIVTPAVQALRSEGWSAFGPVPADALFTPRARAGYDVAVCLYHDQGLIPIKALDFDQGVNVTLGLPFVRTSPDHGTALDIAGLGRSVPDSLVAALTLAEHLATNRRAANVS